MKIGAKLSYDELVELIYTLDEKFTEIKIDGSLLDVNEGKLILKAITKIQHDISSNLHPTEIERYREVLSQEENFISECGSLLIKAMNVNDVSYAIKIIDSIHFS